MFSIKREVFILRIDLFLLSLKCYLITHIPFVYGYFELKKNYKKLLSENAELKEALEREVMANIKLSGGDISEPFKTDDPDYIDYNK